MMDLDRITETGGRVHAWVNIDASKDRSVTYREAKYLYSSICSSRKLKLLSAVQYDSYGKIISSNEYSDSTFSDFGYKHVTPESLGETVLEISCAVIQAVRKQ